MSDVIGRSGTDNVTKHGMIDDRSDETENTPKIKKDQGNEHMYSNGTLIFCWKFFTGRQIADHRR
jgi:hypothetical protein